jgi:hypothetical protein
VHNLVALKVAYTRVLSAIKNCIAVLIVRKSTGSRIRKFNEALKKLSLELQPYRDVVQIIKETHGEINPKMSFISN